MNNVLNNDFAYCVNNAVKLEKFFENVYMLRSTSLNNVCINNTARHITVLERGYTVNLTMESFSSV